MSHKPEQQEQEQGQEPKHQVSSIESDENGMTEVDMNPDQDDNATTPVTAVPFNPSRDSQEMAVPSTAEEANETLDGSVERENHQPFESNSSRHDPVGRDQREEEEEKEKKEGEVEEDEVAVRGSSSSQPSQSASSPTSVDKEDNVATETETNHPSDQLPQVQVEGEGEHQSTLTGPSNSVPSIQVASSSPTLDPSLPSPSSSSRPQSQSQSQTSDQAQSQSESQASSTINRSQSGASSRRDSVLSTTSVSSSHTAGSTHSAHSSKSGASLAAGSAVFVISALESILSSKEAKKLASLRSACGRALAMVRFASGQKTPANASKEEKERSGKATESLDARIVFEPLRLACETKSSNLIVTSLDCIGKLVSYSFFVEDDLEDDINNRPLRKTNDDGEPTSTSNHPNGSTNSTLPLADLVTETVCNTFSSSLSDLAQLQIIKALLATVLSTSVSVHQGSLLKAVRTVYNVFLMSKSTANQAVAQGCLTQMCHHVCGRVRPGKDREVETERKGEEVGGGTNGNGNGNGIRNGNGNESQASSQDSQDPSSAQLSQTQESAQDSRQSAAENQQETINSPPLEDVAIDPETTAAYSNMSGAQDESKEENERDGKEDGKERGRGRNSEEKVTLRTLETRKSFEVAGGVPASERSVSHGGGGIYPSTLSATASASALGLNPPQGLAAQNLGGYDEKASGMTQDDLFVKDAFLVVRALCKLGMKPLGVESEQNLKSEAMRSKLLALHLLLTILRSHMRLFTDPTIVIHSASSGETTPFVGAVKQYLCLALSRNAVSSVNQVFEISCEIFWRVVEGMRGKLKKEIEVLLNEIFLPILEMKTSSTRQKSILLGVFIRLCQDPQALVEIYINYDCDRAALENIYERLMNVVSKIAQTHVTDESGSGTGTGSLPNQSGSGEVQRNEKGNGPSIPPSLSTSGAQEIQSSDQNKDKSEKEGSFNPEMKLKKQSLDCLCSVLRSLVIWSGKGSQQDRNDHPSHSANHLGPNGSAQHGLGLGIGEGSSPRESIETRAGDPNESLMSLSNSMPLENHINISTPITGTPDPSGSNTPTTSNFPGEDDPLRFENAKQRKTSLIEGIRKFNFKPKRGIAFLIENGFIRRPPPIPSDDPSKPPTILPPEPREIARFLLHYGSAADGGGLNKAQIGEYLGEGEPENIAIMHAFVDLMNFENMAFVDALRRFLQAFRLPGEAQKIDRFMLKFAERYVKGNPKLFANADTAYILAFSVIMLNTDAHSPQIKHRMTVQDFIKNNKGINDGESLPEEFVTAIYDEIQRNEIKMKDEVLSAEVQMANAQATGGFANAIATVGRDLQREAYILQSEGMASKTDALFRTMVRAQRRVHPQQRAAAEQFFSASHFEHVRPMFEIAWMPFLAGISSPLQESDDPETVEKCLEGFRDAIRIVCLFGLELERNAFVTTLAKFTFLNNLGEMKSKNIEAIKTLLGVAQSEGNSLKGSWREVLTCVSQLERFQLISGGVDERQLPELGRRKTTASRNAQTRQVLPNDDVVAAGASSQVTVAADMIFSSSASLSGAAIVDFVQALSDVSSEEIQSSGMTENPRLFSLQKLVEISYYNMKRIRMEWSQIWSVLGEHFNNVVCSPNPAVSSFAIDALRQLAQRFLELEELPHFKFQKDFLKPFEYAMRHNRSADAQEMVLQCLAQMIASRIQNMRSGFSTLFVVLGTASKSSSERVVSYAFELAQRLSTEHFDAIVAQGAFADMTVCLTDFTRSSTQRVALQAISALRAIVPAMLASKQCPVAREESSETKEQDEEDSSEDPMTHFWFPCLFAFYNVIMTGDDLEVRRVALDSLFEILKKHGSTFRPGFWDQVSREVLFPIFAVLRSRSDVSKFSTHEDQSVWLSTTMIQALRNLVDLWTYHFETLERLLSGLLELLCACICQENDTLARIGTSCLQQLLEKNVKKLSPTRWSQVVDTFVQLFRTTTAHQLFDPALRSDQLAPSPSATSPEQTRQSEQANGFFATPTPLSPGPSPNKSLEGEGGEDSSSSSLPPPESAQQVSMTPSERRRAFKQIIVKCVLQLLLIETTHELLQDSDFYSTIPAAELLRLTSVLEDSYRFSKRFNANRELRVALWNVGFMKQLPNLLKQESSSAATLVHVLVRMHADRRKGHKALRREVRKTLVPLGEDVVEGYLPLDSETQSRNIIAWTPVVAEVFLGICTFTDEKDGGDGTVDESFGLMGIDSSSGKNGDDAQQDQEQDQEQDGDDQDDEEQGGAFSKYAQTFYPMAVELLSKDPVPTEISTALRAFFSQVGRAKGLIDKEKEIERLRRRREALERENVENDKRKSGFNERNSAHFSSNQNRQSSQFQSQQERRST